MSLPLVGPLRHASVWAVAVVRVAAGMQITKDKLWPELRMIEDDPELDKLFREACQEALWNTAFPPSWSQIPTLTSSQRQEVEGDLGYWIHIQSRGPRDDPLWFTYACLRVAWLSYILGEFQKSWSLLDAAGRLWHGGLGGEARKLKEHVQEEILRQEDVA